MYYRPIGVTRDFVKSIEIARPVFRDMVEMLSLAKKKKKQFDYDTVFFVDEKRVKEIIEILKDYENGFSEGNDLTQVDAPLSELRGDVTATKSQLQKCGELLLKAIAGTFQDTLVGSEIREKYKKCMLLKNTSLGELWTFCRETSEFFGELLKREGELPYREGSGYLEVTPVLRQVSSNFYMDAINTAKNWFDYSTDVLHRMEDDK
jgi:hypothetical protein